MSVTYTPDHDQELISELRTPADGASVWLILDSEGPPEMAWDAKKHSDAMRGLGSVKMTHRVLCDQCIVQNDGTVAYIERLPMKKLMADTEYSERTIQRHLEQLEMWKLGKRIGLDDEASEEEKKQLYGDYGQRLANSFLLDLTKYHPPIKENPGLSLWNGVLELIGPACFENSKNSDAWYAAETEVLHLWFDAKSHAQFFRRKDNLKNMIEWGGKQPNPINWFNLVVKPDIKDDPAPRFGPYKGKITF